MSDHLKLGHARHVSVALRHQEAVVREELRRLSRAWRAASGRDAARMALVEHRNVVEHGSTQDGSTAAGAAGDASAA